MFQQTASFSRTCQITTNIGTYILRNNLISLQIGRAQCRSETIRGPAGVIMQTITNNAGLIIRSGTNHGQSYNGTFGASYVGGRLSALLADDKDHGKRTGAR